MSASSQPLSEKRCEPCEGGVKPLSTAESATLLEKLDGWKLSDDGKSIFRKRGFKNFVQSMNFLNQVGEIAESEQHHPDLHLTGYRNVRIDITTHAIDGLSENDFILAAKIDQLLTSL